MTGQYQLAQVNIARMREPLDSPLLAGFVARLDDINALADDSPGFVWRLQTEDGDATALRAYDDVMILVNLSVWESTEHLKNFVYKTQHAEVMKQRKTWFERFDGMYYALWWVPNGHRPTVIEAREKLDYLQQRGESEDVFTFANVYTAPSLMANEA